jgi:hypothetical protein
MGMRVFKTTNKNSMIPKKKERRGGEMIEEDRGRGVSSRYVATNADTGADAPKVCELWPPERTGRLYIPCVFVLGRRIMILMPAALVFFGILTRAFTCCGMMICLSLRRASDFVSFY